MPDNSSISDFDLLSYKTFLVVLNRDPSSSDRVESLVNSRSTLNKYLTSLTFFCCLCAPPAKTDELILISSRQMPEQRGMYI